LTTNSESNSIRLELKVTANASRNEIAGFTEGVLHVRITAPPVKGKANMELVAFLSKMLGIKKNSISIVKGQASRNKLIAIEGLNSEDIMRRLSLNVQ
jgi:uncharacterized protein (TIGR00251 family)